MNYSITLQSGVALLETATLAAIDLRSGDTLTIDGAGDTLSGVGVYRGLFDYAGAVMIENLTLANMLAQGAAGGSGPLGGGGGAPDSAAAFMSAAMSRATPAMSPSPMSPSAMIMRAAAPPAFIARCLPVAQAAA